MKTKAATLLTFFLILASVPCNAGEPGKIMIGGGVGSVNCVLFDAVMAQAQTAGGMNMLEGANIINPYTMYILGFQTGYNVAHPVIIDVFEKEGGASVATSKILFWIDDWCRKNPEKRFGQGLIAYVENVPR